MTGHTCDSMGEAMSNSPAHHRSPHTLLAAGVAALMLVFALSIWTLIPLGWIWIGSQLAATQFPAIGPYIVVLLGIIVTILAVAWVIGRLNGAYVSLTGTSTVAPLRSSWLRSMRDTGQPTMGHPSLVEAILIISVILATIALLTWFFMFAGSPIGDQ